MAFAPLTEGRVWFSSILVKVSTGTGMVTYNFNVTVLIPTTTILGAEEYHVDRGSAIDLTCVIHNVRFHSREMHKCSIFLGKCVMEYIIRSRPDDRVTAGVHGIYV